MLSQCDLLGLASWLGRSSAIQLYGSRVVTSVYFDSPDLRCYWNTVEGIVPRKKIRARSYGSSELAKCEWPLRLEVKATSEHSRWKTVAESLDLEDFEFLCSRGHVDSSIGLCFPVVEITYKRSYYLLHGLRLTVDTSISYASRSDRLLLPRSCDDLSVLELKAPIDFDVDKIQRDFPFPRSKFSKYERSIEMLQIV